MRSFDIFSSVGASDEADTTGGPDGDRFVLAVRATGGDQGNAGDTRERIVLVQNFVEELKRLVPVD